MDDAAALSTWLKEAQGVDLPAARLREPAAIAARLGALAGAASRALPFGAEPAGFHRAQAALMRAGDSA